MPVYQQRRTEIREAPRQTRVTQLRSICYLKADFDIVPTLCCIFLRVC